MFALSWKVHVIPVHAVDLDHTFCRGLAEASSRLQQAETPGNGPWPRMHFEHAAPDSTVEEHSGFNHTRGFQDGLPSSSAYPHPAIPRGFSQSTAGQV